MVRCSSCPDGPRLSPSDTRSYGDLVQVLVTGATGRLGRALVPALLDAGHEVLALSRTAGRVEDPRACEMVGDVLDPTPWSAALAGASYVVHLASSPSRRARRTEIEGTRHLLLGRSPGAGLLYLSIVGCDRTGLPYYRAKAAAERLVRDAPDTVVVRATQFHGFADLLTAPRLAGRAVLPRGLRLQPVSEQHVIDVLLRAVSDPAGAPAEVAGPEALDDVALAVRRTGRRPLRLPLPLPLMGAVRRGSLLPGPGALLGGAPYRARGTQQR